MTVTEDSKKLREILEYLNFLESAVLMAEPFMLN